MISPAPVLSDGGGLAAQDERHERLEDRGGEGPQNSLQATVHRADSVAPVERTGCGGQLRLRVGGNVPEVMVAVLAAAASCFGRVRLDPGARRRTRRRYVRHAQLLQPRQRAQRRHGDDAELGNFTIYFTLSSIKDECWSKLAKRSLRSRVFSSLVL